MKQRISLLLILLCIGLNTSPNLFAQKQSYSTSAITSDLRFFEDWSCTRLNKNVKTRHLKEFKSPLLKQVATELLSGRYDTTYRAVSYKAYPSNKKLSETIKLNSGFSRYENITGMYLEKGEAVVLVGDLHGKSISLLLPDWTRKPAPGIKPTEDPEGWGLKRKEIPLHVDHH